MALTKLSGTIPSDDPAVSKLSIYLAETALHANGSYKDPELVQSRVFRPQAIRPGLDPNRTYPRVLSTVSDVWHSDEPAAITTYLGEAIRNTTASSAMSPIFGSVGDVLRRRGLVASWTPAQMSRLSTTTGLFVVTAFARIESPAIGPAAPAPAPLAFVTIDLASFGDMFSSLDLGASGMGFLVTFRGLIVASSHEGYVRRFTSSSKEMPPEDRPAGEAPDDLLALLNPLLDECGVVTASPYATELNATLHLSAQGGTMCQRRLRYKDDDYLVQVSLLSQEQTALPWSVVLLTRDHDFYGEQLDWATVQLVVITIGSLLVAILLVSVGARLLTRPIDAVVAFMADVARIAALPASDAKQAQMKEVQQRWHVVTGVIPSPPVQPNENPGKRVADSSALGAVSGERGSAGVTSALPCRRPFWVSLQTREVIVMQRSFTRLLRSWSGYDELEALNRSKRQFIRYIFHEVRLRLQDLPSALRSQPRSQPPPRRPLSLRSFTAAPPTHRRSLFV